jgi:transcriptional regulator with XRE-family HTH domain
LADLAKELDMDTRSLWQIENGRRMTTISNLVKICNYLDVSSDYLLLTDLSKKLSKIDNIL